MREVPSQWFQSAGARFLPSTDTHTSLLDLKAQSSRSLLIWQGPEHLPGGMRKQPQWTLIGRSLDAHWTLQWTLQWTLRKWYQGHDFLCLRIKSFFLLETCLLTPHIQNATPGSVFAVSTVVSTVVSNERPVSAQ